MAVLHTQSGDCGRPGSGFADFPSLWQGLAAGMPSGDYGEFGGNPPFPSTLNSSYSTSLSLPSPYLFVPPAARKTVSDVRRTFCLFVTFDLLFISLLWIIELNVSSSRLAPSSRSSAAGVRRLTVVSLTRSPAPSRRV